jgi:hypothetical protein
MRYRSALLVLSIFVAGCSSSSDAPSDPSATTAGAPTTTSTTTEAPPELSLEERAVEAAEGAVLEAGLMGADFVDNSIAEMVDLGDTIEVTLVPADLDVIGATAIVVLRARDLSVVEVRHYR